MMAGSGHIAGRGQSSGGQQVPALDQRGRAPARHGRGLGQAAQEHPGSWWPEWAKWLSARSGGMVPREDPCAGALPVLEDAPGSSCAW